MAKKIKDTDPTPTTAAEIPPAEIPAAEIPTAEAPAAEPAAVETAAELPPAPTESDMAARLEFEREAREAERDADREGLRLELARIDGALAEIGDPEADLLVLSNKVHEKNAERVAAISKLQHEENLLRDELATALREEINPRIGRRDRLRNERQDIERRLAALG